jgi:hypothetical protein
VQEGCAEIVRKINYLRRFISNLAGKVESFLALVRLKHEEDFVWGMEQRTTFNKIKEYLSSPPVLRAPREGKPFKLYIAAQEHVIGGVLTQEEGNREFVVAYISQRLTDIEARHEFVEKLCLSLYYACTQFRHYILSSTCTVVTKACVARKGWEMDVLLDRI